MIEKCPESFIIFGLGHFYENIKEETHGNCKTI